MRRHLLCLSLVILSASAIAAELPVMFQSETITFERKHLPPPPSMPWQAKGETAIPADPTLTLNVDVRPASALKRQEGWFNLAGLESGHGLLFILPDPKPTELSPATIYSPLDIIFLDAQGNIVAIAPQIILSDLKSPLESKTPVKAILMLQGGQQAALQLAPGDSIINSNYFEKPPVMLTK